MSELAFMAMQSLCGGRFVGRVREQDIAYDEARGRVIGALTSPEVYICNHALTTFDSGQCVSDAYAFKS